MGPIWIQFIRRCIFLLLSRQPKSGRRICHPMFTSVPTRVFLKEPPFRLCPHAFHCLQKICTETNKTLRADIFVWGFFPFFFLQTSLNMHCRCSEPPQPLHLDGVFPVSSLPFVLMKHVETSLSLRIRQFPIRSVSERRSCNSGETALSDS